MINIGDAIKSEPKQDTHENETTMRRGGCAYALIHIVTSTLTSISLFVVIISYPHHLIVFEIMEITTIIDVNIGVNVTSWITTMGTHLIVHLVSAHF